MSFTKKPTGHIQYRADPVSYGPYGPHKSTPWKVVIDNDPANPAVAGSQVMDAAETYELAAGKLAKELAWRDPVVRKLRAKADALEEGIRLRERTRLLAHAHKEVTE